MSLSFSAEIPSRVVGGFCFSSKFADSIPTACHKISSLLFVSFLLASAKSREISRD
jgi:hypothetical protein